MSQRKLKRAQRRYLMKRRWGRVVKREPVTGLVLMYHPARGFRWEASRYPWGDTDVWGYNQ